MLPLLYLDKLLDEIQLRFREMFKAGLKEKNYFGTENFGRFTHKFEQTLKSVENKSKEAQEAKKSVMRTYVESDKSQRTIASMIIDKNSNNASSTTAHSSIKEEAILPKEESKTSVYGKGVIIQLTWQ